MDYNPGVINVDKPERLPIPISTDKNTHFTEALSQNEHEKEELPTLLVSNKISITGVNIISKQPLKYLLIFWSSSKYDDSDYDVNSFRDAVELDMSSYPAFQIENTGPYYLNVGDLVIAYNCKDEDYTLRCSLMNLSGAPKNAGTAGEVQIDIKYSPRL